MGFFENPDDIPYKKNMFIVLKLMDKTLIQ